MVIAKLRDTDIHYEIRGEGFPLVLIPGFASGAWSWAWQIQELARDFRVVAFDPRGIASSTTPDGAAISIEIIADDVAELLDTLEIDATHILGISFGGFVAQEFALKYPERVKKLILASTSFGGPNHVAPSGEILAAFASTEGLNSVERIRKYLATAFSPGFIRDHSSVVDCFCEMRERNFVPESVYLQQLRSATAFDAEVRVQQIAAETLVVSGKSDRVVPLENSLNLAAAIPAARLEIIEGTGHMAFIEKAAEFNKAVGDFLLERRAVPLAGEQDSG